MGCIFSACDVLWEITYIAALGRAQTLAGRADEAIDTLEEAIANAPQKIGWLNRSGPPGSAMPTWPQTVSRTHRELPPLH